MDDMYILKEQIPVRCENLIEWSKFMQEISNRIVQQSEFDGIRISTVFLGLDHSFGDGEPLLFETMIFGGKHDQYQERYSTWKDAIEGHKFACDLVQNLL